MELLVVDDEAQIRSVLREYSILYNYNVTEACNGLDAIKLASKQDFDCIIVDIMMPGLDGYQTIKEIKKIKDIPVIVLSARGEEYDKILGFELGIDDYVVKPFSPKEVMARIQAVIKRSQVKVKKIIKIDTLEIDMAGRNVAIDGKNLILTPKEYELLFHLVKHKGIAVSRQQLISDVWGYDFFGDDRTVDAHIRMLRGNLGKYRKHIITLRGIGYKFEEKI